MKRTKENCCYWDEEEGCIHPAIPMKCDPENCTFYWGKDWLRYTGSDPNYISQDCAALRRPE